MTVTLLLLAGPLSSGAVALGQGAWAESEMASPVPGWSSVAVTSSDHSGARESAPSPSRSGKMRSRHDGDDVISSHEMTIWASYVPLTVVWTTLDQSGSRSPSSLRRSPPDTRTGRTSIRTSRCGMTVAKNGWSRARIVECSFWSSPIRASAARSSVAALDAVELRVDERAGDADEGASDEVPLGLGGVDGSRVPSDGES